MSDQPKKSAIRYFGDYILLGEIARGGMGVVYHAVQSSLDREVAIKMIDAGSLAGEAASRRFQTEAEAMAQLDHPHIVSIYEIGEHEGQRYLAMKLIEGNSLAEQIAEGRWNIDANNRKERQQAIARLMASVAEAVHHAHQRGVLHRDIKPGNILLDEKGEPHVTDFGLAKLAENDAGLSQTGAVLGTPSYMAPEQAAGKTRQITTATDVYALGVVLYELLTGERPFHADDVIEILKMVVQQEPRRPRSHNPLLDRDLETICLKCLEKDPTRRYANAVAFVDDLERWSRGEPIEARPASSFEKVVKWTRRHPAISVLAILLATSTAGSSMLAVKASREAERSRVAEKAANLNAEKEALARIDANDKAAKALAAEQKAQRVLSFFQREVLGASRWSGDGPTDSISNMLKRAESKVSLTFSNEPRTELSIRNVIGTTYTSLFHWGDAARNHERALEIQLGLSDLVSVETVKTLTYLADIYNNQNLARAKLPIFAQAFQMAKLQLGDTNPISLRSAFNLARIYRTMEEHDQAVPIYDWIWRHREEMGFSQDEIIYMLSHLVAGYMDAGRTNECIAALQEMTKYRMATISAQPLGMVNDASSRHNVALGMWDRSIRDLWHPFVRLPYRKAIDVHAILLERMRLSYGVTNTITSSLMESLADAYSNNRRIPESLALSEEVFEVKSDSIGSQNPETLRTLRKSALLLKDIGKLQEAIPKYEQLIELQNSPSKMRDEDAETLASLYVTIGRFQDAKKIYRERIEFRRDQGSEDSEPFAADAEKLGDCLIQLGEHEEAEEWFGKASSWCERSAPRSWRAFILQSKVGESLTGQKRFAEAESMLLKAYNGLKENRVSLLPDNREDRIREVILRMIELYTKWEKLDLVADWKRKLDDTPQKPAPPTNFRIQ